jgi:hypothetical protein
VIRLRMCKTRYAGPTDTRGGRVIATHLTTGKRATTPWDHALGIEENHARAAINVLGGLPTHCTSVDGGGFVFGLEPGEVA